MQPITQQLVTRFWELYGEVGNYAHAWEALKQWSLEQGRARGLQQPGQGWNSASGGAFEEISQRIVIEEVTKSDLSKVIQVRRWNNIPIELRTGILSDLVWPRGEIREPETAESQVDLAAFALDETGEIKGVISVYSCKSSARERYQQDLYWAERLRGRGIKFCFITAEPVLLRYGLGYHATRTSKTVKLGRALYDRIYLLTSETLVAESVSTIEGVVPDLKLWLAAY